MKSGILFGLAAVLCLGATANAEMRIWTSKKGDTVEAEYIKMYGSKVVLKTADGKTLRVPTIGLCDDDQEYLTKVTAVPPNILIVVDDDVERDKQGNGFYHEIEKQTITCNVAVKQTNPEPCFGKFKAWLYVIGEEKEGTKKKILGIKQQAFSFADQDVVEFSLTAKVEGETGYMWAEGFEYDGYLVCVQDESGDTLAVESNQNAYERHLIEILKSRQGSIYTEDFVNAD